MAKPILAQIATVKADGPDTVVFELPDGNVGFPALTSSVGLVIIPDGDTDYRRGMGTGGYILEQFEPGVRSRVKRNPNYWKAGRGNFDTVEMICIKDATARANALLTGQIDAYNAVDPRTVALLERNSAVRINRVKSKAHFAFPMMVDQAPFTSNDVRLAMKYAIDREEIVKRVLGGFGSPGNDHPLSAAYEFYDGSIPQRAYDPDKAKFHLAKAGEANLRVQLHVSETPFAGATDAAVLFSAGYDVKQLLIGAEGTLGIVTRAVIRLDPLPNGRATALLGTAGAAQALDIVRRLRAGSAPLLAAEIMWSGFAAATSAALGLDPVQLPLRSPCLLLVELGGASFEAARIALEEALAFLAETEPELDGIVSSSMAQSAQLWRLREDTDALYRCHPQAPSYDISLPARAFDGYVAPATGAAGDRPGDRALSVRPSRRRQPPYRPEPARPAAAGCPDGHRDRDLWRAAWARRLVLRRAWHRQQADRGPATPCRPGEAGADGRDQAAVRSRQSLQPRQDRGLTPHHAARAGSHAASRLVAGVAAIQAASAAA